jgi:3-oxoacyl-[acyl-carrier-protein] synthase-1
MQNAFIVASALHCSLGQNKNQCIQRVQQIDTLGYETFLSQTMDEGSYLLKARYQSQTQKLHGILQSVIEAAIAEAKYDASRRKELHIFFGSTSMNMGQNEEYHKGYLNGQNDTQLINVGYGYVGDVIKQIVGSNYAPLGFLTACTSSVNAMVTAAKMIRAKKIKRAIVVGIELYNKTTYKGFESLMLISKSKVYKPFDVHSDGIILGEGCSAIILDERQLRDDDFSVLGGCLISDNYSETTTNPDGVIVAKTMQNAINDAGLGIDDIDVIKAHATGSENNNYSEAKAIDILCQNAKKTPAVTALKPFMGHTLGASGTNEIVLIIEAIKNGFVPLTHGFKEKIERMNFTPLRQNLRIKDATVLCNSVGFGGSNCALVVTNKRR